MKNLLLLFLAMAAGCLAWSQTCTPAGNQSDYGTSNTWIGYVYDNADFTQYTGSVTEGNTASASFDEDFGGDYVNYPTNGCPVYTETFSVRYKLTKTFSAGLYQFKVGADDGYRLSLDGGLTWVINHWGDQSYAYTDYATTLSGTYNMVLEYYEDGGGNRVSFSVAPFCLGIEDQSIFGSANVWRGYLYQGMSFNNYVGLVTEGTASNPNFDEGFGGDNTLFNTSSCALTTEQFSARYRLQQTFAAGNYVITTGGDDGYRLSMDGGNTWVITNWGDHGYATTTYTATLAGTYNMVLEYYENGGGNRLSFNVSGTLLPVKLSSFGGTAAGKTIVLNWATASEINTAYYEVEKSTDGLSFRTLGKVASSHAGTNLANTYTYPDADPANAINYYRLNMVDKDGQSAYSAVIKVAFEEKKRVLFFPSVVSQGQVYLKSGVVLQHAVVALFDMTGKEIQELALPSLVTEGQTLALSLRGNLHGSYLLTCRSAKGLQTRQIVVFRQ